MKIRFNRPTTEMPFFHNVAVQRDGKWFKVMNLGEIKMPAVFPSEAEMIEGVKRAAR